MRNACVPRRIAICERVAVSITLADADTGPRSAQGRDFAGALLHAEPVAVSDVERDTVCFAERIALCVT